jgi:hypothetical protein
MAFPAGTTTASRRNSALDRITVLHRSRGRTRRTIALDQDALLEVIDEYSLAIHPIVLGSGKRLFRDRADFHKLELVDCTPTTTRVLVTTYRAAR